MSRDQTVYRINGREVGEMQIVAYACGRFCGIEDFRKYNGMLHPERELGALLLN